MESTAVTYCFLLVGIALVVSVYSCWRPGREVTRNLTAELRDREDRMRQIDELINTGLAAESAQRGYLLTANTAYLSPYATSRQHADTLLGKLIARYKERDESEVAGLEAVKAGLTAKYLEMDRTIDLMRSGGA